MSQATENGKRPTSTRTRRPKAAAATEPAVQPVVQPRANAYKSTYLNKHQFWPLYCEWSHQSELITKKVDCFSVV